MTPVLMDHEITPAGATQPEERPTVTMGEPSGRAGRRDRLNFDARASEPGAVPDRLSFGGPVHPGLRLRRAIELYVRREEGAFVVSSEDLEEFGTGETLGQALLDFSKGLGELYFTLEHGQARLGPDLVRIRTMLHEYIAER